MVRPRALELLYPRVQRVNLIPRPLSYRPLRLAVVGPLPRELVRREVRYAAGGGRIGGGGGLPALRGGVSGGGGRGGRVRGRGGVLVAGRGHAWVSCLWLMD